MILAIDIGNTNIVFGIHSRNEWLNVWRIQTDIYKTSDEYEVIFLSLLTNSRILKTQIELVIISSVVPTLNREFEALANKLLNGHNGRLITVSPGIYDKLPLKILNPYEIGTDLVANATAAYMKFKTDCMVIDFGTALTFTTISGDGEILGISIAPGLRTAVRALAGNTAQLPFVQLTFPPSVLGSNTVHAIQAGVMIGYGGLIDRIIEKTEDELQKKITTVATGGLSGVFAPRCPKIHHVEENLTLEGLKIISDLVETHRQFRPKL